MSTGEGAWAAEREIRDRIAKSNERIAVVERDTHNGYRELREDLNGLGDKLRREIASLRQEIGDSERRVSVKVDAVEERVGSRFDRGRTMLIGLAGIATAAGGIIVGVLIRAPA